MTAFGRRLVRLEPGELLDRADPFWRDALVLLLEGELDVECAGGHRHCFREGDILTLSRLPLGRVRNGGEAPTRLLAIWRRASPVSFGRADRHTEKDHD